MSRKAQKIANSKSKLAKQQSSASKATPKAGKNPFKINIGEVWHKQNGHSIEQEVEIKGHLLFENLKDKIKFTLELIRIKNGVTALFKDLSFKAEMQCKLCLKIFTQEVENVNFERLYIHDLDPMVFEPVENFLIDKKDLSIDLSDALRQEIILQFPMIEVCSSGCKGLCQVCGLNLNENPKHKCKTDNPNDNRPLAILKDLVK